MTAKYFAILTNYGAAQLANAVALGTQMNISAMAVGDGGGTLPVPDPAQTKLVRETRRAAVNQVSIDEKNPNFIIAEQVIPENEGGWFIREIGLFDDNDGLIAVGNVPETYKPNLQEGSGRTQVIQMVLMVSSTQAITLKVDPSVVLATREYVTKSIDAAIQASEARAAQTYQPKGDYVTNPYLKLELLKKIDKADITQQLGNDTGKVVSQNLLTTELGKKAGVAEVNGKLAKDQNGADIPNKDTFIKNLGLPEKYQPKGDYALVSDGVPAGSIIFIAHGKGVKGRYLKANGAAVSRTVYAELFGLINTYYGAGDGSTTFNLPDIRDEFPRFSGDAHPIGSKQSDAMRNLTGFVYGRTVNTSGRVFGSNASGVFETSGESGEFMQSSPTGSSLPSDRLSTLKFDASKQVDIANEFRPRNIALEGWIKY